MLFGVLGELFGVFGDFRCFSVLSGVFRCFSMHFGMLLGMLFGILFGGFRCFWESFSVNFRCFW